jgi:phosphoribosylglycinamide formyltransferase-1
MLTVRQPLRVAVMCSNRAPGLMSVLDRDDRHDSGYEIVCCLTSETTFAEKGQAEARGIPCLTRPIRTFYEERGRPRRDLDVREAYDTGTLEALEPFHPDLVFLIGYLYVLTPAFLEPYRDRILNLHHADLLRTDARGRPLYPGLHAVREAVMAGEPATRSTVHLVTERLDEGPALLRSWAFPVSPLVAAARRTGRTDILRAYAYAHQEWMLAASWGSLIANALDLMAAGQVRTGQAGIRIAGGPAPWDLDPNGRLCAPVRRRVPAAAALAGLAGAS